MIYKIAPYTGRILDLSRRDLAYGYPIDQLPYRYFLSVTSQIISHISQNNIFIISMDQFLTALHEGL